MTAIAESACELRAQYKSDLDALRRQVQSLQRKLRDADQMLSRGELSGFLAINEAASDAIHIGKTALEVLLVRDRSEMADEAGAE